jgi:hypothetical protein
VSAAGFYLRCEMYDGLNGRLSRNAIFLTHTLTVPRYQNVDSLKFR